MEVLEQIAPAGAEVESSPAADEAFIFPISYAQKGLWFLSRFEPDSPAYNIATALRMSGALKVEVFERSLNEIVRRHEILRTTFAMVEERPVQIVYPAHDSLRVELVDLRHLPGAERAALVGRMATEHAQEPFDLSRWPLIRVKLLRLAEQEHVLLLSMHHIIGDGWSTGVLIHELSAIYKSFSAGQPSPLDELPLQYADYAIWQEEWLSGEVLESQLAYWRRQLEGAPPALELPTDRPRPAVESFRGKHYLFYFSTHLSQMLKALSRDQGTTLFMTLLAAFQTLLYRYTSQTDIVVGSPIANRNRAETEQLIGFFVNTLVMRTRLEGNPTFSELLQSVREMTLGAYAHQDMPFERLVEELQPKRDLSRSPIFQVMFILQNAPTSAPDLDGVALESLDVDNRTAKFDLTLSMQEEAGEHLSGTLEYNADLFDAKTIERMAEHFEVLLETIIAFPHRRIDELPLLTTTELRQMLVAWNETDEVYSEETCVHELFEQQAARTREAIAVEFEGERLTYHELNARSNQLARHLQTLGVGPETLVGICVERSIEMVVGLLGILKTGGGYVPVDPEYPQARRALMLEDARVSVLLTQQHLVPELSAHDLELVCLDSVRETISRLSEENLRSSATADNRAYTIYTSGSTGRPKGVQISHRAVVNFLASMCREPGITAEDVLLSVTTLSFDIAALEIYLPLITGARLVIVSRETATDGRQLAKTIDACGATVMQATPATWRLLLEAQWAGSDRLKILCGGEALSGELAQKLLGQSAAVWNMYGPTETTIWSALKRVEFVDRAIVEIGRPIANTHLFILDARLRPVPVGVPGELYIGGDGLMRGYLNRPGLTAEKLVPHPFSRRAGELIYRTGDRARYLRDGQIEFLGRFDDQLKIRGHRIEAGEIETALEQHPAVASAVVLARADASGDKRLVAYVVTRQPSDAPGETAAGDAEYEERMSQWQMVWDKTYANASAESEPALNLAGWNSSYTGQPIPPAEMREWIDHTVQRVLSLRPERVLELGCGTGLLLSRIAPHCRQYCGTDFSPNALNYVQQFVTAQNLRGVTLLQQSAEDFSGIEAGTFDTVILNSVIQYFPDVNYLLKVLEGVVRIVKPGGHIFLGDVRSLPLLETFHSCVQLHQAPPSLPVSQLRQRIQKSLLEEEELLVAPGFFRAFRHHLPGITDVRIQLKRGRYHNELTRFRYDVLLQVGGATSADEDYPRLDWKRRNLSLAGVRELLAEVGGPSLLLTGVPNARCQAEHKAVELLAGAGADETVGDLRATLALSEQGGGFDPEDLLALSESLPYSVEVLWNRSSADGSYDVMFRRRGAATAGTRDVNAALRPSEGSASEPWDSYVNNPLQGKFMRRLVPRLYSFLDEKLPSYMIPAAFVLLAEMPLTPNGKVDRRALSMIEVTNTATQEAYVGPRNEVEEAVAAIWAEVLGLKQVGINDNFFEMGGHSLFATQVISRLHKIFGLELPLRSMFESPTVAGLAEKIEAASRAGESLQPQPVTKVSRERNGFPLSFAQQRLWFLHQLQLDEAAYNLPVAVRLTGQLDLNALERTLTEVVRRHEVLRTSFIEVDGRAEQFVNPPAGVSLPVLDLSHLPPHEREAEASRLITEQARGAFDLARAPMLLRASLIRLGEHEHLAAITMHHIAVDGWSLGVLINEVAALYAAYAQGMPSPLPELSIQYADFADWQRRWLQGESLDAQLRYWKRQLAGAPPVLDLPTDRPRPPVQTHRGAQVSFHLPAELAKALNELSRREGVTLFMTLLAAWQVLLGRYTGQTDIVVGADIANRNVKETEDLIGFFVNMLVLRTDLSGNPSFSRLLQRVREVCLDAYAHQNAPFEKLVEELQPESARNLSHSPLFQVLFVLQNAPLGTLRLPSLTLDMFDIEVQDTQFELVLDMQEIEGGLRGTLRFNTDLFEVATIERMAGHLRMLLEAIVSDPRCPLRDLPLLTGEERHLLLSDWCRHPAPPPPPLCVHQLFEAQAAATPEATALVADGLSLSYAELDARSNRLAHYLRTFGIGPEVAVGLCLERGADLIVALLGVLKAGGAYLPLDPEYPLERLSFMLEDTGAPVLLTTRELLDALPAYQGQVICLDEEADVIAAEDASTPENLTVSDNLAYVIYTSGSTGRPKGAAITHRGVVRLARGGFAEMGPGEVFLQLAPISFDASTFEVWGSLLNGARLVVASSARPTPAELGELIRREGVTTMWLTAGFFHLMVDERAEELRGLRQLLAGGDVLSPPHVEKFKREVGGCRLINGYGPTEATTFTCCYEVGEEATEWWTVPIGYPIGSTEVYILDRELELVPEGVWGELYIGGAGLARGYVNRPALTGERFVPHPFGAEGGERLYRSGDVVRWMRNGVVEFKGRADGQVKVRGYRIEVGEVEQVISRHPVVQDVIVLAREEREGEGKQLFAYVVAGDSQGVTPKELRAYVKERLPEYMVPAAFMLLDRFPLTPNGKVDAQALPSPGATNGEPGQTYEAPRNPVEETIALIWSELLHVERIGVNDNFFELGGHSIFVIQLLSRLNKTFGLDLPLRVIYDQATLAELALAVIEKQAEQADDAELRKLLAELEDISDDEAQKMLAADPTTF